MQFSPRHDEAQYPWRQRACNCHERFDTDDRFARAHDLLERRFERGPQVRAHLLQRAAEMLLDRDAVDIGEWAVDA